MLTKLRDEKEHINFRSMYEHATRDGLCYIRDICLAMLTLSFEPTMMSLIMCSRCVETLNYSSHSKYQYSLLCSTCGYGHTAWRGSRHARVKNLVRNHSWTKVDARACTQGLQTSSLMGDWFSLWPGHSENQLRKSCALLSCPSLKVSVYRIFLLPWLTSAYCELALAMSCLPKFCLVLVWYFMYLNCRI